MIRKSLAGYRAWGGVLLLVAGALISSGVAKPKARAQDDAALNEKVISYIREKFGYADSLKITATPFLASSFEGFLTATITTDDGKQQKNTNIFLTNDRHYLILGIPFTLGMDPKTEIVQHAREVYKVPESTTLTMGPFHDSGIPNFIAGNVIAEVGTQKQTSPDFYITKDNRIVVFGSIFNLGLNLRRDALRTIVTANQPTQGPAHAPVTIVEYADLQCPSCARLHEFLEKELLPKYGDKVRVIFKEFPLPMHDWSQTAAIANECVYQIKPEAYAPYRSLVFQNQTTTTLANVRDNLLGYADQVGVERVKLAGCLDSKASLPRVDEGAKEGKQLDVQSTPTCFINGRMLVGFPSPEAYYQVIDAALKMPK